MSFLSKLQRRLMNMSYQNTRRSERTDQSINIHQALNSLKRSEHKKAMIQNRICIMRMNYERNQRKVRSIQTQMQRLQQIKQNYSKERSEVRFQIRKFNQTVLRKNQHKARVVKEEKTKLPLVKQELENFKAEETQKVKNASQKNIARVQNFRRSQLMEKQLNNIKMRKQEEFGKVRRTLYISRKIESARSKASEECGQILSQNEQSLRQLQQIKQLQLEMINKLASSRASLSQSRCLTEGKLHPLPSKKKLDMYR